MRSSLVVTLLAGSLLVLAAPAAQGADGRKKLADPKLTVAWEDRTLREVATDLGVWLDIPFALSRAVRERAEETLSLNLKNVPASGLLRILQDQMDIRYVASHGIVWVTTLEDAVRRTSVLRVYDVRVLTTRPTPIRPPREMGLRGQRIEQEVEVEEPPAAVDEGELEDLLRGGTGGDEAWAMKGTSLRLVNGRLFVRHTPEVHAKVQKILMALGKF